MWRTIKKILIATLFLACLVCLVVGCSNEQTPTISFSDETKTVVLGETYRLELAPIASGTEYYLITASVSNSKGEQVNAEHGYFTVEDVNGYVVKYTATRGEDVKQRTVTLNVVNERAPNIVLGECKASYEMGERFLFPTVTVYDLAGETLTPTVEIYKVEGEAQIKQTLSEEDSFLCESAGEYLFQASATNSFNVTGCNQFRFYVNEPILGEVDSFRHAGIADNVEVNSRYASGYRWVEQCDGEMGDRQGLLKIDVKPTKQLRNIVTVTPRQAFVNYLEKNGDEYKNQKFVVTMYVAAPEGSIPELYAHFTSYRIKDIHYNAWYDYSFDAAAMLKAYESIVEAQNAISEATDEQALAKAESELTSLKNNALSLWGTFTANATLYIDRIAFAESEAQTSVSSGKSYSLGTEISLATEMPVAGYEKVEYTVSIAGKPVAITSDKFTPQFVSDEYTVVASVKDRVNALNDNAELSFKVTAENGHTARLNDYTRTAVTGDEVIEPTIEIYDSANQRVEGYTVTRSREFISNAGVRSAASSFTTAKSGTFEYILTAEKDGVQFMQTARVRVGPFKDNEVIALDRADVLELFGTSKAELLTTLELNELKTKYAGVTDTALERVLHFTKNDSDKSFAINFKPVHTVAYYRANAGVMPAVKLSLYLASANEKVTEFTVELFQSKDCRYTVAANEWTEIEVSLPAMLEAMEDGRLYPYSTWTHNAIKVTPKESGDEYSIANCEFSLFLGDILLRVDANGDNFVQDW